MFGSYLNLIIVIAMTIAVIVVYAVVGHKHLYDEADEESDFRPEDVPQIAKPQIYQNYWQANQDADAGLENVVQPVAAAVLLDGVPELAEDNINTMQIPAQHSAIMNQQELFPQGSNKALAPDVLMPEIPLAFGYKICWLAIPNVKASQVAQVLQLHDIAPANWNQGLTTAYEDNGQIYLSPSLDGWVLVIGRSLWNKIDMSQNIDGNEWLYQLSRNLGDVYYFSTMRDLNNHAWAKLHNGVVKRAYAYSGEMGEVMWNYGNPTDDELGLGFHFPDLTVHNENVEWLYPNENDVLAIAAAWSIDTSFSSGKYRPDLGLVGRI